MASVWQLDEIWLSVFGLGLALGGLVWLLVAGRLRPAWRPLTALIAAALASLAGGAAYLADSPPLLWQPLVALGLVAVVMALASSAWPGRTVTLLASLTGRSLVQGLALVLVGALLAGWHLWQIESGLNREMELIEDHLTRLTAPIDLGPAAARLVRTDAGTAVPLFLPRPGPRSQHPEGLEALFLKKHNLELKLIQTAPPQLDCNCHGWIFAAGRYWLRGQDVDRVLVGNGYVGVQVPALGDVAIYRNDKGEVSHSGLVRTVAGDGTVLLVESKFGRMGRYLHTPNEHIYSGQVLTMYRSDRAGHQLRGMDEPALAATGPGDT
jgi:hypothetical protein